MNLERKPIDSQQLSFQLDLLNLNARLTEAETAPGPDREVKDPALEQIRRLVRD